MRAGLKVLVLGVLGVLGAVAVYERAGADVRQNPHEIFDEAPGEACEACHKGMPPMYSGTTRHALELDADALQVDGTTMCNVCHTEHQMHMVGVVIEFPSPKDLPLDGEKKVICLTCHYAHGKLTSDRPWAAVSFMDRLTNNDDLHKSYLLRRNNSNGELCLVCHDTQGATKQ